MEIYFEQQIDNSRVVRVADPRKRREQRRMLAAALGVFGLLFGCAWQRFEMVRLGYRIQAAKTAEANLAQWNRGLALEQAALSEPSRIYTLAQTQLGMVVPAPQQVEAMESAPAAAAPATAALQAPPRRSFTHALTASWAAMTSGGARP